MKTLIFLFLFIQTVCLAQTATPAGKVVVERIYSPALENKGGENPTRRVSIYLPPDYEETTQHYPVIYFLHGFTWNDSLQIAADHFDKLLDKAINTGKIKPVIVVIPNQHTLFRGSFYTNSSLTGNWADFTAKDLVAFIDKQYRTLPNKANRGVAGHSMGGHGAIKMGMLFPEVFSSVYALSPAILGMPDDINLIELGFKRVQQITSRAVLIDGFKEFRANVLIAMGRTFSPNLKKPPFFCDLPFTYKGDSVVVHKEVLELWRKNQPIEMMDIYLNNLKSLTALKLDWGRHENYPGLKATCITFSRKLENLGINHYAEEYIGTHTNKIWTDDGRVLNDMLPFFNRYLNFE